jgi:glycosyltransferase involved in cell wall biosynthesis
MLDGESPNTDAAFWIENELVPKLPTAIVEAGIAHIGAVDPGIAARFKQDVFRFIGVVADLESAYNRARVFLAPTRFGSGIPLKVIEAAASGLPCVITSLLASQLCWTHERECLVADTPKDVAREIARLHEDEALWLGIQERALARVATEYSEASFDATLKQILSM